MGYLCLSVEGIEALDQLQAHGLHQKLVSDEQSLALSFQVPGHVLIRHVLVHEIEEVLVGAVLHDQEVS